MPQPTVAQVHVNRPLTTVSTAYIQSASHFIASQVFPQVSVEKQSDDYYTWTKEDWFRDEAKLRAASAESAGSGFGLSTASYACKKYALHKDIDDDVRANADPGINLDAAAAEFLAQRMLLRQEKIWCSTYFANAVWGNSVTPSALWSSYETSDPIGDVEAGKRAILVSTGYLPNTGVVSYDVWIKLKHHPDILDRIVGAGGPSNPALVTRAHIAQVFELERLFVAMAIENTAVEGEVAAYGFTHGKHMLLCYVPPAPSLLTPSAGYTFVWRGVSEGFGATIGTKRFRMEHLNSDRVESQIAWDAKLVATDLGYLLKDVVA